MARDGLAHRQVVFGAAGFIGSHLVERLVAEGCDVLGVDRVQGAADIPWALADYRNAAVMRDLLQAGDVVHLMVAAGVPDSGDADPRTLLDDTVGATLSFLEACRAAHVARVMFPSSGGTVYGIPQRTPIEETHPTDPIAAYGVQKLTIEKYLAVYRRLHGLDSIVMRIANPFGPRQRATGAQGLVAVLGRRALLGERIEIWGDGEVVRDYVFIDDVVNASVALTRYDGEERVFNVGSGAGRSVNQIVEALRSTIGAAALDVVYKPARPFDVPVSVLDVGRLRRETGWAPQASFAEALRATLDWMRVEA